MAVDISTELRTIRTGVYGEDIRMAIHDALKKLETGMKSVVTDYSEIADLADKINNLYGRFSTEDYAADLNDYVSSDHKYSLSMFDYNGSTLNTPYSEGLTGISIGCGFTRFSAADHGNTVQMAIVPGLAKIFMRTYYDGWGKWVEVASA